jgi:hypothetical protein
MSYSDYLETPYWRQVSAAVKERAGFRCQICNSPHDLRAHHRDYRHRGRELEHLDDLTCLCNNCHSLFHRKLPAPTPEPKLLVSPHAFVLVTNENKKLLDTRKDAYWWFRDSGIDMHKKGWRDRAVGKHVPGYCFRPAKR